MSYLIEQFDVKTGERTILSEHSTFLSAREAAIRKHQKGKVTTVRRPTERTGWTVEAGGRRSSWRVVR